MEKNHWNLTLYLPQNIWNYVNSLITESWNSKKLEQSSSNIRWQFNWKIFFFLYKLYVWVNSCPWHTCGSHRTTWVFCHSTLFDGGRIYLSPAVGSARTDGHLSDPLPTTGCWSRDTHSPMWSCLWLLGIWTQALMLAWQMLCFLEPFFVVQLTKFPTKRL